MVAEYPSNLAKLEFDLLVKEHLAHKGNVSKQDRRLMIKDFLHLHSGFEVVDL
jgi:hypothetical protein